MVQGSERHFECEVFTDLQVLQNIRTNNYVDMAHNIAQKCKHLYKFHFWIGVRVLQVKA
jgi:hypothetical protein